MVVFGLYALLNGGTSSLEDGLHDLSDWIASYQGEVAPSVQRELYYPGDRHGATVVAPLADTPGLTEFLTEQLDGSASWAERATLTRAGGYRLPPRPAMTSSRPARNSLSASLVAAAFAISIRRG